MIFKNLHGTFNSKILKVFHSLYQPAEQFRRSLKNSAVSYVVRFQLGIFYTRSMFEKLTI